MIPKNWDDISINQFTALQKSLKKKTETERERLNLLIDRTCILTGLNKIEALRVPLTELNNVDKLLSAPMPEKIQETFKLNGIWYEFILNPNKLDAWRYAGIMEAAKRDPLESMAQVMFYLSKPFKLSYKRKYFDTEESDIPNVIKDFGMMPVTVAYPIAVFFLKLSKECTNYFHGCSLQKMTEMEMKISQAKTDLQELTDGSKQ